MPEATSSSNKILIKAVGRCLCGAIELHATEVNPHIGACHCSTCRGWGGGALLAVDCGSAVTIKGTNPDRLQVYKSSEWAERGFCGDCGTHLFYRIKKTQQHIVNVGLFDELKEFELDHQIFVDEKPDYYEFKNKTKMMTGAEVFAMYAPE